MARYQTLAALCGVVILTVAAPGGLSSAGEPLDAALKAGIVKLLQLGWEKPTEAFEQSQKLYQQLQSQFPGHAALDYAYALVQLKRFRYAEAARAIDRVAAVQQDDLTIRKLRCWLAGVSRQYDVVLKEMERMADLLAAEAAKAAQPGQDAQLRQNEQLQTAQLLGRVYGFLEGPGRGAVDDLLRAKARQYVGDRLSDAQRAAFDEARRATVDQFAALQGEIAQKTAENEKQAERIREETLQQLAARAESLRADIAAAESRNQRLKEQLDAETEKLDRQRRDLSVKMQRVEDEARPLRSEIRALDLRIGTLLEQADREKDPNVRNRLLHEAAMWRATRDARLAVLDRLGRQLAGYQAELAVVDQRAAAAIARYQRSITPVEPLLKSLERTEREVSKIRREPVTGRTPEVTNLENRAAAFTTYVPLPISLEAERQALLDKMR